MIIFQTIDCTKTKRIKIDKIKIKLGIRSGKLELLWQDWGGGEADVAKEMCEK